jgi:membrane associated rhomboid family serine protease
MNDQRPDGADHDMTGDDSRTGRSADERSHPEEQPVPMFNAPPVVVWLAGAFLAVHVVFQIAGDQFANWLLLVLAFIPLRLLEGGSALPGGEIARVTQFVSYAFVHGDWMHLAMNSFWMLAFGSVAARRLGGIRFLLFSALAAAVAASFSLAVNWGQEMVLIGASGAIAGQMAIAVRLIFAHGGSLRTIMQRDVSNAPPEPLLKLFTNRSAVTFLVIWLGLDIFTASTGVLTEGRIAWEAHLGGFVTGLLMFPLFDRWCKARNQYWH